MLAAPADFGQSMSAQSLNRPSEKHRLLRSLPKSGGRETQKHQSAAMAAAWRCRLAVAAWRRCLPTLALASQRSFREAASRTGRDRLFRSLFDSNKARKTVRQRRF